MDCLKLDLWTSILYNIDAYPKSTITDTYKRTGCTYAHMLDVVRLLKDKKFITTMPMGRTTLISTTPQGRVLAKYIGNMRGVLDGTG